VFAIVAGAFVPLNFLAVRLAQAYTHPRVFATTDGGLPAKMQLPFYLCLIGMALLFATLWKYEMASKHTSAQLRSLRRKLGGDDAVARPGRTAAPSPRTSRDRHAADNTGYVAAAYLVSLRAGPDLRRDHVGQAGALRARAVRAQRAGRRARRGTRGGAHMSELLVLGISHNTAPVALRERLALTERAATRFITELVALDEVDEAVAISTCNRTEIYLVTADPVRAEAELLGKLARGADIRPTELAPVVYSPRNCDAARQLYRVTAGLDSMIIGEAEVQGQVRRAYEAALEAGTTGPMTNRLFGAALQAGKRVRSETGIGRERVSISSVAVDLARDVVGHLESRSVVIIGAGETAELTAQALVDRGVRTVFTSQPPPTGRARWPSASAEVGSLDSLPRACARPTSSSSSTSSRTRSSRPTTWPRSCASADGRPLRAHRTSPCRATSSTPAASWTGASASTTWTTCRPWWHATSVCARPSGRRPRR
jgi:hypothetical protein